jgi:hypothetical protein
MMHEVNENGYCKQCGEDVAHEHQMAARLAVIPLAKYGDDIMTKLGEFLLLINQGNALQLSQEDDDWVNSAIARGLVRWGTGDCRGLQLNDDKFESVTFCCDPRHASVQEVTG